jgi:Rrf2 family nitric oxide-sensitive transcriptional repressor
MLTKTAEYALRTVAWLASEPERAESADVLAERTKVPRRYLHKVLQDLVKAKLVRSRSGPGGGYALARSADEITILDVVNAVAPLERIRHCPLGLPSHTSLCPLHKELDQVYAATEAAFARVKIGELLRSSSAVVPLCDVARLVPITLTGAPR